VNRIGYRRLTLRRLRARDGDQHLINLAETNPSAARFLRSVLVGAAVGMAIARKGEGALVGAGVQGELP
jgi:hypothetical protein